MYLRVLPRAAAVAVLALLLALIGAGAPMAAQDAGAYVNFNTWLCPEGYDHHSDCEKIGGVTAQVEADGTVLGEITSVPGEGATIDVPVGSTVTVTVNGGQPEGTTLEASELTFVAQEGANPVTLVFVEPATQEPVDTDGDGLSDDEEVSLGTDPTSVDTDADGVQDGGEINAGTDPLAPDTDGDGFSDKEELDRGSDPLDPANFPQESETNEFNIQVFNCPAGHEGKATPDVCTEPAAGVEFTVYIPGSEFAQTAETDANGVVTFGDLGSGTFVLRENLDDLGFAITRYTAMCVGNNAPGVPEARQISYTDLGNVEYRFELTQGEIITCGWYNYPAAAAEPTAPVQTPTAIATQAPVTRLPVTGSGDSAGGNAAPVMAMVAGALTLMALAAGTMLKRRNA